MSREYLFRGKRIDNGEWVEGSVLQFRNGYVYIVPFDNSICEDEYGALCATKWYKIDPETVSQYTGLTDSTKWEQLSESEQEKFLSEWNYKEKRLYVKEDWNGRKIFDRDIIAFTDTYSTDSGRAEVNCIGEVLWDEEELCFHVTERSSAESWEVLRDCYVIGNIFENPDLLE